VSTGKRVFVPKCLLRVDSLLPGSWSGNASRSCHFVFEPHTPTIAQMLPRTWRWQRVGWCSEHLGDGCPIRNGRLCDLQTQARHELVAHRCRSLREMGSWSSRPCSLAGAPSLVFIRTPQATGHPHPGLVPAPWLERRRVRVHQAEPSIAGYCTVNTPASRVRDATTSGSGPLSRIALRTGSI